MIFHPVCSSVADVIETTPMKEERNVRYIDYT